VDFETSYHELREVQEKTLEVAIKEAQEEARQQMLSEIETLRQEVTSEILSRRDFYENEIASITQGLQARQNISSPPLPSVTQSNNWKEIELLLQDTQRQLEQPPNNFQVLHLSRNIDFCFLILFCTVERVCIRYPIDVKRSQCHLSTVSATLYFFP
jgi:N-methylhydantoinase B/oxoprolinase/acetone carboxylase alpha subunit